MHVGLICFDFSLPGIKMLSAYLKQQGFTSSIVYLKPGKMYDSDYRFSPALKENLAETCRKFDVVGVSVFTHNAVVAADLTMFLKERGQPLIVWGGIHATIAPEDCLQYADGVCIGEGEETFTDMLSRIKEGLDHTQTEGFWFKNESGEILRNPLRNPPEDLDALPLPDVSYEKHYIQKEEELVALDRAGLTEEFSQYRLTGRHGKSVMRYLTVFSRGCPYSCTFCCNNTLNAMFGKHRRVVRTRSVQKMVEEILLVRQLLPDIGFITIQDDNFLAQSREFIREFARRWPEEVGLPFKISGSVVFMTPERLTPLVDAGLMHIEVGVQTGSDRVNKEVYCRPVKAANVLKAAQTLNVYKDRLLPAYDFIFDNPYETFNDRLQTARLIQALPKPYALSTFSLVYFPGTTLYQRALDDQIITDFEKQVFHKKSNDFNIEHITYLKLICLLLPSLPSWIGRILLWRPLAQVGELPFSGVLLRRVTTALFWLRHKGILRRANVSTLTDDAKKIRGTAGSEINQEGEGKRTAHE
jgi:anaerobic magnesium-protoporphyrin IX monomethyl ester cyclase